jgi:hypothetical protein
VNDTGSVDDGRRGRQAPFPDLIPDIISYASVNLLAGASGVGKTCLVASCLKVFYDGGTLFGHQVHTPVRIGFISADRGEGSAYYWLTKVGLTDLAFYSLTDDPDFSPPRLRAKAQLIPILAECIAKLGLPPGSLLIVDPVALFLGGNLLDYQACAVALIELRRLCIKLQITLIGLAHASKQKGDKKERYSRLQDRIMGSGAQLGYGDTQMYLASPEETGEKFYTFLWHPHTAPAEVFKLGRNPDGLFVPYEDSTTAEEESELFQAIPESPETIAFIDLCKAVLKSRATVYRHLQPWLEKDLVIQPVHGRYCRPQAQA